MLNNCQLNNFQITHQIGAGAYGVVFHAVDLITENEYAIKAIMKCRDDPAMSNYIPNSSSLKKSAVLQTQLYHYFKSFQNKLFLPTVDLTSILELSEEQLKNTPHYREVQLHLRCHSHENVVTIHQILESSLAIFVVMDYHPNDLFTSIVQEQHFCNDGVLIKKVFLQLCSALNYCHSVGVYHCDIKPENVLLDSNDNAKLCDFGLATTNSCISANVCVGSSYYMAPERVSCPSSVLHSSGNYKDAHGNHYFSTSSGDIWSLGIILINLTCIRNPWLKAHQKEDTTFKYFIRDSKVLLKILPLSEELFSILNDVLQIDPTKRITLLPLIESVASCTRFTSSGPLAEVEPLTRQQLNLFICGNESMRVKGLISEFESLNASFLEQSVSDSSEEACHNFEDNGAMKFPLYSSNVEVDFLQDGPIEDAPFPNTGITPNGFLDPVNTSKLVLRIQSSQFNLSSTPVNDSQNAILDANLDRWLPQY